MKTSLYTFFVFSCCWLGLTQAEPATDSDLSLFESDYCVFRGEFEQHKQIKGLDKPILSQGVFYYHCEQGVIWKTIEPVQESLIFTTEGVRSHIEIDVVKSLKSHQSKLLAELMMGLIGWQQDYIANSFDWQPASNIEGKISIGLIPKKRSIKRGIKQLQLSKISDAEKTEITISILDRNSQNITIFATEFKEINAQEECSSFSEFSAIECKEFKRKINPVEDQ